MKTIVEYYFKIVKVYSIEDVRKFYDAGELTKEEYEEIIGSSNEGSGAS